MTTTPESEPGANRCRRVAVGVAAALLALAAGCASPDVFVAETFQGPARGWVVIAREGETRANDLVVEHGRLRLGGMRVLCQDFVFEGDFHGIVDFGFAGGDPEGFAGVFVEQVSPRPFEGDTVLERHCLAVNARGEWRGYLADSPVNPFGSGGWLPLRGPDIAGPIRFSVERAGRDLRIRIEGDPEAVYRSTTSWRDPAYRESRYRLGVFTFLLDVSVDNFIAGDDPPGGAFDPLLLVHWGDPRDGDALLAVSDERLRAFLASPRRMAFLGIVEPLQSALAAASHRGDEAAAAAVRQRALRHFTAAREALARAGAEDLLALALASFGLSGDARDRLLGDRLDALARGAADAREAGRPAESLVLSLAAAELRDSPELRRSIDSLRRDVLAPLALDLRLEDRRDGGDVDGDRFRQLTVNLRDIAAPAVEAYGAIPRAAKEALAVEIALEEARLDRDRSEATRRLEVAVSLGRMTAFDSEKLLGLEARFPEDVRDAVTRARVLKSGKITPDIEASLRRVSFPELGVREAEVHRGDVRELEERYREILRLRGLRDQDAETSKKAVLVPAYSVTTLARFRLSFAVTLEGRKLLEGEVRAVEGIEQWEHPAYPEQGVQASSASDARVDAVVAEARDRVVSRLRTAISRESLFSKLDRDEATRLIIRIARATGSRDDSFLLQWRLKQEYGLSGLTLERVTRQLLE